MTRFNEAIDQALAESVGRFSDDVDRSRDTFIAVLGDDLRMPLQVMTASAGLLAQRDLSAAAHAEAVARIPASVLDMNRIIGDLLEYTRTRLGKTIPIHADHANVERIVRGSLAEVGAGHPQRSFRVETASDLMAFVDSARLQQAITNLLGNAVEHGRKGSSVEVIVRKDSGWLAIEVSNEGAAISPEALQVIFDPLQHVAGSARRGKQLGLGLFVAREIAVAHGGTIEVKSSDSRTTFTIRIPLEAKLVRGAAVAEPA
jgi:signal transduction histidine kinase